MPQWSRFNANPDNFTRRTAENDARRLAAEPPIYAAELRGGTDLGWYLEGKIWGQYVHLDLRAPYSSPARRPRCETMSVWHSGQMLERCTGMSGLLGHFAGQFVRPISRREIASLPTTSA